MAKYPSFGTLLKKGDGAVTEAFTTVGGVMDISGPARSRDTIEATAHDSPNGDEEIVPGLKRSGPVTFDIAYDPADPTHEGASSIRADFEAGTLRNYKLVLTDAGNMEVAFAAYLTGWGHNAPVNGLMGVSVELKPTGALVYTP